jgi:hypothetical protein
MSNLQIAHLMFLAAFPLVAFATWRAYLPFDTLYWWGGSWALIVLVLQIWPALIIAPLWLVPAIMSGLTLAAWTRSSWYIARLTHHNEVET